MPADGRKKKKIRSTLIRDFEAKNNRPIGDLKTKGMHDRRNISSVLRKNVGRQSCRVISSNVVIELFID